MTGYGVEDTDVVYRQGVNLHGLAEPMYAAAQSGFQRIWGVSALASTSRVGAALDAYCVDNSWRAASLEAAVREAGSSVADVGNIVVGGENEMTHVELMAYPSQR